MMMMMLWKAVTLPEFSYKMAVINLSSGTETKLKIRKAKQFLSTDTSADGTRCVAGRSDKFDVIP